MATMRASLLCALLAWPISPSCVMHEEVGTAGADARPNLLVLVTDDHPFDALGCAGNPVLSARATG